MFDSDSADPKQPPAPPREPGNRMGALGLMLVAAGAGRLLFDVPPTALLFSRRVAVGLAAIGATLLILGLLVEWRGPRRWSALVPGVAAVAFGGWLGLGAWQKAQDGPQVRRTNVETATDSLGVVVYSPNNRPVEGCAVLAGGARDVRDATARALASRGIIAVRGSQTESPEHVSALGEALKAEHGVGCSVVVHGSVEEPGRLLAALSGFDRAVAVSLPAANYVMAPRSQVPTLYLFGSMQGEGQKHASALMGQLGQVEGGSEAILRIFLGADQDLLAPRQHMWRQPGHLAAGYADMLTRWIVEGVA